MSMISSERVHRVVSTFFRKGNHYNYYMISDVERHFHLMVNINLLPCRVGNCTGAGMRICKSVTYTKFRNFIPANSPVYYMKELNNCQKFYNPLRYIIFILHYWYDNLFQHWEIAKLLYKESGRQAFDEVKKAYDAISVSNTNSSWKSIRIKVIVFFGDGIPL